MKCYAIKRGKENNKIVFSWPECEALTTGIPYAKYKKFDDVPSAEKWLETPDEPKKKVEAEQKDAMNVIYIFCDGACSGNPGPGGWGSIIRCNGQEKEMSGYEEHTTNNAMELKAFLSALEYAFDVHGKDKPIVVTSDSNYLLNGAKSWMFGWAEQGWKRPGGEIANIDIWKRIFELTQGVKINYVWIKGHSGHPENERCDKMAVYAYESNADTIKEPEEEKEIYSNYDLIQSLDIATLHQLLCSTKFKNIIFGEDALKVFEMLNAPAQDFGIKAIKEILKNRSDK